MNIAEYTIEAKKTITYKTHKELIACTTLSLGGELGEYITHQRGNSNRKLVVKELGDLSWGLAILANHLGIVMNADNASMYCDLVSNGLITVSQIQEIIKKVIRDRDYIASDEDKLKLTPLFEELLYGIQKECAIYRINFSDVLQQNIEKLASRKERGVLQGTGDER